MLIQGSQSLDFEVPCYYGLQSTAEEYSGIDSAEANLIEEKA